MAQLFVLKEAVPTKAQTPPAGTYRGLQSGYRVRFEAQSLGEVHCSYTFTAEQGIRGINVPVTVKVEGGQVTVV